MSTTFSSNNADMLFNNTLFTNIDINNDNNNINNTGYNKINNSATECADSVLVKISNTQNNVTDNEDMSNKTGVNSSINAINIYRYKFTEDFTVELYNFAKIHQYDDRKDFKEAWKIWVEENEELVDRETRRLTDLEYDGDILDKMFKSARYYFRKKSTEKAQPQKRKEYLGCQKELLEKIDEHIKRLTNNLIDKNDLKPSICFENFCKENDEYLNNKVEVFKQNNHIQNNEKKHIQNNLINAEEIKNKIKKTYKNRYFLIIKK